MRQFFPLYDADRNTLASTFYDNESLHTISINISAPRLDQQKPPAWSSYIKHSRNLIRVTQLPARTSREYHGVEVIKSFWATIPSTRHPDLSTETAKYLIDCHPIPGLADPSGQNALGVDGLMLMVHGEFEERDLSSPQTAVRSFSRTFILGPGQPGQLPIRVVSDALMLRAWSPLARPTDGLDAHLNGRIGQDGSREDVLRQLVARTTMTSHYAALCLEETGWDLEKAFVAFEANKDKLPPDAFFTDVI